MTNCGLFWAESPSYRLALQDCASTTIAVVILDTWRTLISIWGNYGWVTTEHPAMDKEEAKNECLLLLIAAGELDPVDYLALSAP